MVPDHLIMCCIVGLLFIAIYTDLRFGKIYNWLTIPCMMLGISLNAWAGGWQGLLQSLGGALLVMVLFLFLAPAAGIGGGDTKLMMAVGSLIGLKLVVWAILYSAIIGGILALIVMLRHRALMATTRNMAANLMLKTAFRAPTKLSDGSKGIKFKYSPAIALGTFLALWLRP